MQVGKGLRGFLKNGTSVLCHQVLGKIGDDAIFGSGNFTAGRLLHSGKYL